MHGESVLPFSSERSAFVNAPISTVFEYVDDPARLAAHMSKSSWRMGGGSFAFQLDDGQGKQVGSHIRLSGKMFGFQVSLDEIVTDYGSPILKVWETCSEPRLLVIGSYRMGFELSESGETTKLRVFLDYAYPVAGISRLLSRLCGRYYADWCVHRMVQDTVNHFAAKR